MAERYQSTPARPTGTPLTPAEGQGQISQISQIMSEEESALGRVMNKSHDATLPPRTAREVMKAYKDAASKCAQGAAAAPPRAAAAAATMPTLADLVSGGVAAAAPAASSAPAAPAAAPLLVKAAPAAAPSFVKAAAAAATPRGPELEVLHMKIPTVLFGETADLNVARVGGGSGGAWHIVPLHIRVDGSGGAFFYALRAALPAGDYVGIVRVTGKDGAARWLPIPIAGLATVDNGCGDGGRNSLFSVAK